MSIHKRYTPTQEKQEQKKNEVIAKKPDTSPQIITGATSPSAEPVKTEVKPAKTEANLINGKPTNETSVPAIDPKEPGTKSTENGNAKIGSTKKQDSKLKKKLIRLFSKKTNKPARPNYEKCTTKF